MKHLSKILLLIAASISILSAQGSRQQDSLALVALYNSTNGSNWTDDSGWLTSDTLGNWHGIDVSGGRVVRIFLDNNNLSGTLPAEIGDLTALKVLLLSKNQISGSLPEEIGNLKNLTDFEIAQNKINGPLPGSLWTLTNLTDLRIYMNPIGGLIPPAIGNLTNLTYLAMTYNDFTGSIPEEIGNLTKLKGLLLYRNQLSGTLPSSMANLTKLNQLSLGYNHLSGEIPSWIGNLSALKYNLDLSHNQFSGAVPQEIANLWLLEVLNLSDNELTEMPLIVNMPLDSALAELDIQNNNFDFGDIEPNINVPSNTYNYSPQDSVGILIDTLVETGQNFTLNLNPPVGGDYNQYQWYKGESAVSYILTSPEYTIPNITIDQAGDYICRITNTVVTDLTLNSRPLRLNVVLSDRDRDSLALVALYDSLGGPSWTNQTNWLSGENIENWYGVSSYGGRVVNLNLSNNNLSGIIPAQISDLTNLQSLDFRGNNIQGWIPESLGAMMNLEILNLGDNQLTGKIPIQLSELTNLTHLHLSNNRLIGNIPSQIKNLINLERLSLDGNELGGEIPPEIGQMPKLRALALENNQISGAIPAELGQLANTLEELTLFHNQLNGNIPSTIGELTKLVILALHENQLSGFIPTAIGNLTDLQVLALSKNNLSGQFPIELLNLHKLVLLWLDDNQLSGAIPSNIKDNLSGLHDFRINNNHFNELPLLPSSLDSLFIQENQFDFGDIIPNINVAGNAIVYAPQDSVGEAIDTTIYTDSSFSISVNVAGENNIYKWYKNGTLINGAASSSYLIENINSEDAGVYRCDITNDAAPDLTLNRRKIHINVVDYLIFPDVLTKEATNITNASAQLNGSVTTKNQKVVSTYFQYGLTNDYLSGTSTPSLITNPIPENTIVSDLNYEITNLLPDTIYYFRLVAKGEDNVIYYGNDLTFRTNSVVPPDVQTKSPTDITQSNAVLHGMISAKDQKVVKAFFLYGLTTDYTDSTDNLLSNAISENTTVSDINHQITNLLPDTTYHFQLAARTDDNRLYYGTDLTFRTLAATETNNTVAITEEAQNISINSAELFGRLNPNGIESTAEFQYSTDNSFSGGITHVKLYSSTDNQYFYGSSEIEVNQRVTGLQSNTTYYYKIVVYNSAGTKTGAVKNFTTSEYSQKIQLTHTFYFPDKKKSEYKASDYVIIGLPGESNMPIGQVLGGTFGEDWTAYWDNGETDNYLVKFDPTAGTNLFWFTIGKAFWVLKKGNIAINNQSDNAEVNNKGEAMIPVHAGWNLITNPFNEDVIWDNVKTVNSNGDPVVDLSDLWRFADGTFSKANILRSYEGFYVYASGPIVLNIKVPYPVQGSAKKITTPPAKKIVDGWEANIILNSQEYTDNSSWFGVSNNADEGFDPLDSPKPRAFGDILNSSFEHPEWEKRCVSFASDIRAPFDDLENWDFTVNAEKGKKAELSLKGLENIPDEFDVYLIDKTRSQYHNLRDDATYYYIPSMPKEQFTVVVGKDAVLQDELTSIIPKEFKIENNFPNPFNPETTIPLQLPQEDNITVNIYNVLGEKVVSLYNGRLEAGRHLFRWNAENSPSGIYFYRVSSSASAKTITGKMILMK